MEMKTTLLASFCLAFALSLSTALGRAIAAIAVEPVLDYNGNPVVNGGLYLLIQAGGGPNPGGGIQTSALDGEICPISVVQATDSLGQPLRILDRSTQDPDYVYPTNSLDIVFQYTYPCTNSSKLIVKNYSAVPTVFVGEKDENTVLGYFHIQKHENLSDENLYKFAFCPGIVPGVCWNLGFSPSGDGRLVKNQEDPFLFVIWGLESGNSASIM